MYIFTYTDISIKIISTFSYHRSILSSVQMKRLIVVVINCCVSVHMKRLIVVASR